MTIEQKLIEKRNEAENLSAEITQLEEIMEYNKDTVETRGRKKLFNEPLTERITFLVTKKQNEKLNKVLEEQTLDKSSFIRGLIFGFS